MPPLTQTTIDALTNPSKPSIFYPQCHAILKVVFDGFGGDDSDPTVIHVLPRSANVHLNGYRQADTFDLEFDGKAFPFSPELIRAAAVEIYLFQTDGLVPAVDNYINPDNLTITGLVDDAALEGSSDGLVFRCSGRDYTTLMLDKQWPVGRPIPVGKPIDSVVQQLVDECTHYSRGTAAVEEFINATTGLPAHLQNANTLNVRFIGDGDVPTAHQVSKTTTAKVQTIKPTVGGSHSRTNKRGIPVRSGKSYWDVIYSLCLQHGLIVFVRGNDVIISKPQILSDAGRQDVKHLSYGRNLGSLNIERHMGREQVPQIVVSSYNEDTGDTLEAKWPPDSGLASGAKAKGVGQGGQGSAAATLTGIGTVKETIKRYTFPGIRDKAQATEIAKTIYQTLGRSEAKIHFSTIDLKDLRGNDLLTAKPGNGFEIGFDEIKVEMLREMSVPQRESKLRQLGYSETVAHLIATEFDKINHFKATYYLKDLSLSWSNSTGISIEGEAINFISVGRDDKR